MSCPIYLEKLTRVYIILLLMTIFNWKEMHDERVF